MLVTGALGVASRKLAFPLVLKIASCLIQCETGCSVENQSFYSLFHLIGKLFFSLL